MKKFIRSVVAGVLIAASLFAIAAPTKKYSVTYTVAWYPLNNAKSYLVYYQPTNTTQKTFLTNTTARVISADFPLTTPSLEFFCYARLFGTNKTFNATLKWDEPQDATIVGYILSAGQTSAVYSKAVYVDTNYATVNDLTVSNYLYFAVASYNPQNIFSPYSEETNTFVTLPLSTNQLPVTISVKTNTIGPAPSNTL